MKNKKYSKNNNIDRLQLQNSINDKKISLKKASIQDKNNYKLKIESKKCHFEFQYSPNDIKYKNNNFINIKYNKNFITQKAVDFSIEHLNKNLFNFDEINQRTLINNLKKEYKQNVIKMSKYKNNSVDGMKNNNYYKIYKNNKKKKVNSLKKYMLIGKINNLKIEEPSIKTHSRNLSLNYNYEPSFKDDFLDSNHILINDDDFSINNNLNFLNSINNTSSSSQYLNKEKKYKNCKPKRLEKFINKKNALNDNNIGKNISSISPVNNINNIYKQNNCVIESSFNFNKSHNKENEKVILMKLSENIIEHGYSKETLLDCFNKEIPMSAFLLDFQDNIELIFKNNNSYEKLLKYLYENIPKIIRNRLGKKDLNLFFVNNVFNNYNASNYIKRLIVNDNKFLVEILNKYYDNISSIVIKNKLYKSKTKFLQEMKNLTADIIFS